MFLFHIHAALRVSELLAEQFLGYGILFGGLLLMFRIEYERPFWRSLGWTRASIPFLWNVICGMGAAFAVAMMSFLIHTPNVSTPLTDMMQDRTSVILLATFESRSPAVRRTGVPRFPAAAAGAQPGRGPGHSGGRDSVRAAAFPGIRQLVAPRRADRAGGRVLRMDAPGDRFHAGSRHHARVV